MLAAGVRGKIGAALERFVRRGLVASDERSLAGSVSGAFFVVGGVTLVPLTLVPGTPHGHRLVMLVLTFIACAWGAASLLLIDWERAPSYLIHFSVLLGLVLIGTAVASSGGAASPGMGLPLLRGRVRHLFLRVAGRSQPMWRCRSRPRRCRSPTTGARPTTRSWRRS